jgi:hypothetical protein
MPRVKQSQLARARGGNEMSQSVAARMTRNKMRADWDTVHAMLTDPRQRWATSRLLHCIAGNHVQSATNSLRLVAVNAIRVFMMLLLR